MKPKENVISFLGNKLNVRSVFLDIIAKNSLLRD